MTSYQLPVLDFHVAHNETKLHKITVQTGAKTGTGETPKNAGFLKTGLGGVPIRSLLRRIVQSEASLTF